MESVANGVAAESFRRHPWIAIFFIFQVSIRFLWVCMDPPPMPANTIWARPYSSVSEWTSPDQMQKASWNQVASAEIRTYILHFLVCRFKQPRCEHVWFLNALLLNCEEFRHRSPTQAEMRLVLESANFQSKARDSAHPEPSLIFITPKTFWAVQHNERQNSHNK